METYIITGATGGLGLATAHQLASQPNTRVVLAVRNVAKAREVTQSWRYNIEIHELDLADLSSIDTFVANWKTPIAGLMNNAGVQIVSGTRFTAKECFEETVAVNHLAALKLTNGMMPHLKRGRVLFVGSGSHSPRNFTAGIFGFRGARFQSMASSVKGEMPGSSERQAGMDRYATSKFLNMVTTVELARRNVDDVAMYCLDPGLMAGTGLVRTDKPYRVFAWRYLLPLLAWMLPDKSSPQRSAQAAAWILSQPHQYPSGTIFSFNKKPAKGVWEKVFEQTLGKQVLDDSLALLNIRRLGEFTNSQ